MTFETGVAFSLMIAVASPLFGWLGWLWRPRDVHLSSPNRQSGTGGGSSARR